MILNATLPTNTFIVATKYVSECGCGVQEAYCFNTDTQTIEVKKFNESDSEIKEAFVDATNDMRIDAAYVWMETHTDLPVDQSDIVGCVVQLHRSQKAPNNTNLVVCDFKPGGYQGMYFIRSQIAVDVGGESVWVSYGCIKKIVRNKPPFWLI